MNHAVLLYKDTSNPQGIPGEWPCETQPLGTGTTLPKDGRNWQLMTDAELTARLEQYAPDKETWNQAREAEEQAQEQQQTFTADEVNQLLSDIKLGKTTVDQAIDQVQTGVISVDVSVDSQITPS